MADFTLRQFAVRMATIAQQTRLNKSIALAKISKMMEKEAKSMFGREDNGGQGPFRAWAPLSSDTVESKQKKGQTGRISRTDPLFASGSLRESVQSSSDSTKAVVGSNHKLIKYHEFGTKNMPPRSTIGLSLARVAPEAVEVAADHILGPLANNGRKPRG